MFNRLLAYFLSIVLLVACSSQPQQPTLQPTNTPTLTPSPTSTNTPTPTITPSPTPLPMAGPVTGNFMTRLGKGWAYDLIFSPNGKILSVATSIGVYLYQVETMELISFLPSNTFVETIAFIDDENLIVGYKDSTIAVWNIENTPVLVDTLQHNDPAVLLTVTDENSILVVESGFINRPVNIVVWDRVNPGLINSLMTAHLSSAAFSGKNNLVVLQTNTGKIMLVDAEKMKYTATICFVCLNFALSQSGELLAATTDWDQEEISIFDTTTRKEIIKFKNPDTGTRDMAFSPDGKLLTLASSSGFNLWDVETAELVNTFEGSSRKFVYSPDGLLLASVSQDGILTLIETKSGNKVFSISGFTSMGRTTFEGKTIASIYSVQGINMNDMAGGYFAGDQDTIFFRDISTGEIVRTYSIAEEKAIVESITFSPDRKIMASSWNIDYKDKILVLFDVTTGERLQTLEAVDPIVFSPDGSMLATSAKENQLVIWDVASGEILPLSLGLVPVHGNDPYKKSLVFSSDGSMIAILSDTVIFRDLIAGKRIKILESGLDPELDFRNFDGGGTGAIGEFSPDGVALASTWLVKTTDDFFVWENAKGVVILWDVANAEKIAVLEGHSKAITALTYSPDGTLLATGSKDKTIIIWDAQNGNLLKVLQGHSGAINSLAFSSDGNLLYSNALDGTVIIWSLDQLLP